MHRKWLPSLPLVNEFWVPATFLIQVGVVWGQGCVACGKQAARMVVRWTECEMAYRATARALPQPFVDAGIPAEKITVIPESFNEVLFDPAVTKPMELADRKGFNFLSVVRCPLCRRATAVRSLRR